MFSPTDGMRIGCPASGWLVLKHGEPAPRDQQGQPRDASGNSRRMSRTSTDGPAHRPSPLSRMTDPLDTGLPCAWARAPRIRALSTRQAEFILTRNQVGRLAFLADGRLELVPVHYVYTANLIVGRTSFGAKCLAWMTQPHVVFEVDEPEGLFEWRSVIVRGDLRTLTTDGDPRQALEYWNTVAAIRTLDPDALSDRDPTPTRRVLFTILPHSIAGRESSRRYLSKRGKSSDPTSPGDHTD